MYTLAFFFHCSSQAFFIHNGGASSQFHSFESIFRCLCASITVPFSMIFSHFYQIPTRNNANYSKFILVFRLFFKFTHITVLIFINAQQIIWWENERHLQYTQTSVSLMKFFFNQSDAQ